MSAPCYPAGSDTSAAPWNQDEAERDLTCNECGVLSEDVPGFWSENVFYGKCLNPECGVDLEYDASPDPDDGRECAW